MIHRGEQGFDAIHDEPSEADGGGLGYELRAARPQSGRRPIRPHIVVAKRIVAERPQQTEWPRWRPHRKIGGRLSRIVLRRLPG